MPERGGILFSCALHVAVVALFFLHLPLFEHKLPEDTPMVVELVTNSYRYSKGIILLTLIVWKDGIHIRVCDESPVLPMPREAREDDESGRGSVIVQEFTTHYQEAVAGTIKVISCVVPTTYQ